MSIEKDKAVIVIVFPCTLFAKEQFPVEEAVQPEPGFPNMANWAANLRCPSQPIPYWHDI